MAVNGLSAGNTEFYKELYISASSGLEVPHFQRILQEQGILPQQNEIQKLTKIFFFFYSNHWKN